MRHVMLLSNLTRLDRNSSEKNADNFSAVFLAFVQHHFGISAISYSYPTTFWHLC